MNWRCITILLLPWIMPTYGLSDDCSKGIFNDIVLINGVCHECPRGLYGVNCSQACPKGLFGHKCSDKCECSEDKFCHPVYGCVWILDGDIFDGLNHTGSSISTTPINSPQSKQGHCFCQSLVPMMSMIISSLIGCCVTLAVVSCTVGRWKYGYS